MREEKNGKEKGKKTNKRKKVLESQDQLHNQQPNQITNQQPNQPPFQYIITSVPSSEGIIDLRADQISCDIPNRSMDQSSADFNIDDPDIQSDGIGPMVASNSSLLSNMMKSLENGENTVESTSE